MKIQRYLFIWVGLFLPTVGIGIIAMSLLAREQTRLDALEQTSNRAQAQTIADNADLIMAEIKTGVLQELEAASGEGNESARLSELTNANPLIDTTYIWTSTQTGDFTRSFASQRLERPQTLINLKAPPWGKALPKKQSVTLSSKQTPEVILQQEAESDERFSYSYSNAQSKRANIREFTQYNVENINRLKDEEQSLQGSFDDASIAPTPVRRSAWIHSTEGEPSWLAWYQHHTEGRVTGALLDTTTVLEQLQEAFPYTPENRITYRIEAPNTKKSSYASSLKIQSAHRIPLGAELPDWHLTYTVATNKGTHSLLLLGGLLVAILCLTSLGSGTLILVRARKDARDSAQKSTFVSNVSHELRTPLTTIRMYTEMLEDGRIADPSKQQRYLQTITSESQRLTRLVDNVLDFSHLDQGRKRYQYSQIDLVQLINTVLKSQEPRLSKVGMNIRWSPPSTSPELNSDSDAIEQVLLNLIDNAAKYASAGKQLEITLRDTSAGIELCLADQGPGIASRDRKKIFKAFQRLNDSLTSEQPGSGLGLSICRGIIRDLGGDIKLTSNKGSGCCFSIQLPHTSKHLPS